MESEIKKGLKMIVLVFLTGMFLGTVLGTCTARADPAAESSYVTVVFLPSGVAMFPGEPIVEGSVITIKDKEGKVLFKGGNVTWIVLDMKDVELKPTEKPSTEF